MNETKFITTRKAKEVINVKEDTLRKWADNGIIPSIRTPTGQRLYDISKFIKSQQTEETQGPKEKQRICYCRVSSQGQKEDLQRQVTYMQQQFPGYTIITDIASGINFKRKGLRTILELASKGTVSEVVVAYRDRLCRFAFELVEWVLQLHGVKLVVLHPSMESSKQAELAEDLLAIINVFNCRVNGKRKYQKDTKKGSEDEVRETTSKQEFESEVET